jgi:putative PIN family toxin of toxin-antitoxin system
MDAAGAPHEALKLGRVVDRLAMSRPVFDEIFAVLHRPKLSRFLDPALRDDLLDQLVSASAWFDPTVVVADCRDPADDKYLELALAAGAAIIVSGDRDLLILDPWRGVRIIRPAAYLTMIPQTDI